MTTILAVACAVLYLCGAVLMFDMLRSAIRAGLAEDRKSDAEFFALGVIFWWFIVIVAAYLTWRDRP